ncbi:hypothetical protein BSS2_I1353 [Brucella suis bv. 1 str. S2]|uniref:Transposase n=6 Tax=Brucella TaxID=234 RepID=Q2YS28_BRUA2|nr:hypothetical protein BR1393 [Brucella suis 1330]ABX62456.1 Hypothetical protein, conserved [Brucella canis ATCC 23365]ABY38482.1 Hypothetical protein, conserved [Brucella suis ATCC 23445]ACO01154.1 Hypothetical protein, conserved [Brucella melitensis ATCC 23457]ACU48371.1 hypothetical protein BMI_I1404 [Brucella microti CCM 4915]AEK54699.1 hypothetical protein BPI_I1444 [Brucella pinnipedialis B2/94]AEU06390.1 hypothetical protein BSVBI22_A1387 [Brucella suis VBI22]AHN47008.1 hypothetical
MDEGRRRTETCGAVLFHGLNRLAASAQKVIQSRWLCEAVSWKRLMLS